MAVRGPKTEKVNLHSTEGFRKRMWGRILISGLSGMRLSNQTCRNGKAHSKVIEYCLCLYIDTTINGVLLILS